MSTSPSSLPPDELVAAYRRAADAHGSASESGDYKTANPYAEEIAEVFRELRQRGEESLSELLVLLNDPSDYVRAWAASHALTFAPADAEPVLVELSGHPGASGLSARMTLHEWRAGRLRFP